MTIAQSLLPEFDHEVAGTRKVLERIPADKFDWRPHPKSFSLGQLANHAANLVSWGHVTLRTTELDLSPKDGEPMRMPIATDAAGLVANLDGAAKETRAALEAAADADFGVAWTLKGGDQVYFTMPRGAVLRSMVFNHLVHHRAQLTVYLRLLDLPVPGLYGPSADEA